MNRRTFIKGLGGAATTSGFAQSQNVPRATAQRVIFILLAGGAPHLDLFDYKPELEKHNGKVAPEYMWKGKQFAFMQSNPTLLASPYKFKRHGESGMYMSELLPNIGANADDLCMINSMHTDQFNHGPAQLFLMTGSPFAGRPSMGSWIDYALGSVNENLPSFVTMVPGKGVSGGKALWNNGFLPGKHQGVQFMVRNKEAVFFLNNPDGVSEQIRQDSIDALSRLNNIHYKKVGDKSIETTNYAYKLASKMQTSIPHVANLKSEPERIRKLYGEGAFAKSCLMGRRLLEQGTRFIQINYRGTGLPQWDLHGDIPGQSINKDLPILCKDIDQGIGALIKDLKQRGMLDDTLVVVSTEFGRTCMKQNLAGKKAPDVGRDHWPNAYSTILAGGGVKGGLTYGQTDEFGYEITSSDKVHVHDLQATVLHTLGIDHEQLTYRYQGRDFRLTDVHGKVVKGILA